MNTGRATYDFGQHTASSNEESFHNQIIHGSRSALPTFFFIKNGRNGVRLSGREETQQWLYWGSQPQVPNFSALVTFRKWSEKVSEHSQLFCLLTDTLSILKFGESHSS